MFVPIAPLLLAAYVPLALAAPVPESKDNVFELDRRLFGLGGKKTTPAAAKPTKPVATQPLPAKTTVKTTAIATTATVASVTSAKATTSTSVASSAGFTTSTLSVVSTTSVSSAEATSTSAAACAALPSSTVVPPKPSLLDSLFKRDDTEFIGWHGTNSKTADLWTSTGSIVKPTNDDGSVAGKSGLDAELGSGLYISDTLSVAESASAINAQNNNLGAKACAIFAKSSKNWRQKVIKAQMPESIRGNGAQFEQIRQLYLKHLARPGDANSVKIGPLSATTNQLLIPESVNPTLQAQCFDVVGLDAQNVPASIPTISYTSADILAKWEIIKGDEQLAAATKAAIQKGCA